MVVAVRMRRGKAADVRGAPRLLAEALVTVRAIAPAARVVVRGDSKFYTADVVATAARYGAAVSLTTGSNPSVNAAIAQVPDTAWTAIHCPNAFVDQDTGALVSDAEVAQTPYTAFGSRPNRRQVDGRLIVRRVKRLNPATGQDGLFEVRRHHAVFITSGFEMLQAQSQHRGRAIVEQLIADAAASALAHLPSGSFPANAAWALPWAIAHNLTRATGALAGAVHARATTATIRAHLINVPARLARRRPPADPAPAPAMALGTGLGQPARRDPPTTRRLNAHRPHQGPTGAPPWKSRTDRRPPHTRTRPP